MRRFRKQMLSVGIAVAVLLVVLGFRGSPVSAAGSSFLIEPTGAGLTWPPRSPVALASVDFESLPAGAHFKLSCNSKCSLTLKLTADSKGVAAKTLSPAHPIPAGSVLTVRITARGWIGYYRTWTATNGTLKRRPRLCLAGSGQRPRACHYQLKVSAAGTGLGTVGSADLNCSKTDQNSRTCSTQLLLQQQETLTATAASGSTFAGWSGGGCAGVGTCTVTMRSAVNVTAAFVPTHTFEIAYQATGGRVSAYSSATGAATSNGPRTSSASSPSIAAYSVAFSSTTSGVSAYSPADRRTATVVRKGIEAGTSPSIAASPNGGYEIAFEGSSSRHYLMLYSSTTNTVVSTHQGMEAGASPSIAALPDGSYEIAYQDNRGKLRAYSSTTHQVTKTHQGMNRGIRPSICALPSGYEIAFQAKGLHNYLYAWSPGTGVTKTPYSMSRGTDPSIASGPDGRYEIAFQAAGNHYLAMWSPKPTLKTTNYGMDPATSPSIAVLSDGNYEIAFQNNAHDLWNYSSVTAPHAVDTTKAMEHGTSPSIEGF